MSALLLNQHHVTPDIYLSVGVLARVVFCVYADLGLGMKWTCRRDVSGIKPKLFLSERVHTSAKHNYNATAMQVIQRVRTSDLQKTHLQQL